MRQGDLDELEKEKLIQNTPSGTINHEVSYLEDPNLYSAHLEQQNRKLVPINPFESTRNQLFDDPQLNPPKKTIEGRDSVDAIFPELWRNSLEERGKRMNENGFQARLERLEQSVSEIKSLLQGLKK
ncbi:hypothetical protein [Nitrososphaera sp. AFS]|uniref:hypothetical protein n=1 Tax=Nitrososphaera sp. AFS TaxID=2301191 RepID=UPI0013922D26|nr:hypothetical protein [Nitrososphaera sp. AFS]NAL77286.1 hypothetical protein [Nitrososphaera sp. AFS]